MNVSVERSGGFAGLRQVLGPVATEELPDSERDEVHRLVASLPPADSLGVPDAFHYRVIVEGAPDGDGSVDTTNPTQLIDTLVAAGASWRPVGPVVG
jgi:hypothetical protein